jgi:hypothetical protein
MDKAEFIEKAPLYYALAILLQFRTSGRSLTRRAISNEYYVQVEGGSQDDITGLVDDDNLWDLAVKWLEISNAVVAYRDPFGPPVLTQSDTFESEVTDIFASVSPFRTAEESGDARNWTFQALQRVESERVRLGIGPADFIDPERDWAPLPVERENESLKKAIVALDETITQVEQSNGYASEHPEERNFVLDNLRMLSSKLKSAGTVSMSYVRTHGLNILEKLQHRFIDTAIGEGAKETTHTIVHWLRELVDYIF